MSKESAPPPGPKDHVEPMTVAVGGVSAAATDSAQGPSPAAPSKQDSKPVIKRASFTDAASSEGKKLGFQVADDKPQEGTQAKTETAANDDDDEDVPLPPTGSSRFRRKDSIAVTKYRMLKQLEEGLNKSEEDFDDAPGVEDSGHKHPVFQPPIVIPITDTIPLTGCFKVEELIEPGTGGAADVAGPAETVIELPQAPDDLTDVVVVNLDSFVPVPPTTEPAAGTASSEPPKEPASITQQSAENLRAGLRREVEQVIERRMEREQLEELQRDILRRQFEQELQKEYQRAMERDIQQEFRQPLPPGVVLIMSGEAPSGSSDEPGQKTRPQDEQGKGPTADTGAIPKEQGAAPQAGTREGSGTDEVTSPGKQTSLIMLIPSQPILKDRPDQQSAEPEFPSLLAHEPEPSTSAAILILQFEPDDDSGPCGPTSAEPPAKGQQDSSKEPPPDGAGKVGTDNVRKEASQGSAPKDLSAESDKKSSKATDAEPPAKGLQVPPKAPPSKGATEVRSEEPQKGAPSTQPLTEPSPELGKKPSGAEIHGKDSQDAHKAASSEGAAPVGSDDSQKKTHPSAPPPAKQPSAEASTAPGNETQPKATPQVSNPAKESEQKPPAQNPQP